MNFNNMMKKTDSSQFFYKKYFGRTVRTKIKLTEKQQKKTLKTTDTI